VVNVTSGLSYDPAGWESPLRETDPLGGVDPYSNSKACSELVSEAYRRSFFDTAGPRVATARAGNVIGGGDWGQGRLLPDLMRALQTGGRVTLRDPDAIRPWQHALDPLHGYLMLAEALWSSDGFAGAWNFAPAADQAYSVRSVAERIADRSGQGLRWEQTPRERSSPGRHLELDCAKARAQLGWAGRWGLSEAIDRVVDWHAALRAGADMRAVTLEQIEAFSGAEQPLAFASPTL
jgi:CDP-glucose 4,6-dehydratase